MAFRLGLGVSFCSSFSLLGGGGKRMKNLTCLQRTGLN